MMKKSLWKNFAYGIGSFSLLGLTAILASRIELPPGALSFRNPAAAAPLQTLKLPSNVLITSSAPLKKLWDELPQGEKELAYHLVRAASYGREILFYQQHRHAIEIRNVIEKSLSKEHLASTKALLGAEAYNEYLVYSGFFEDQASPYSPSNRRYGLSKITEVQARELFKRHAPEMSQLAVDESVRLLIDPNYELLHRPENPTTGEGLENTGWNGYEHGITGPELMAAIKGGLASDLNCRIVRRTDDQGGELSCQVQALNNPNIDPIVRTALEGVVAELKLALPLAHTDHQRKQMEFMIAYLSGGAIKDFRQSNIEWVRDRTNSPVDFNMAFTEVYEDFQAKIGSWESYVQFVDPKMTSISVALAKNAQHFEDLMPYGKWKKTFPADYSPPAMMVYYFQEIAGMHSKGYNLPNFDDIRRDYGAKNVIKLDLPGTGEDEESKAIALESARELAPAAKAEDIAKYNVAAYQNLALLHEIIGHGSGTYDTDKYPKEKDPISELGSLGSALEEQRADLTAIVFYDDVNLVKVGIFKDAQEAEKMRRIMYDAYMYRFLTALPKSRSLAESHQRGRWLFVNWLLKAGAVKWASKDGKSSLTPENQVLEVVDYDAYREVGRALLAELQRIKANRDEVALHRLFDEDAPLKAIDEPWAQAVIARGEKLRSFYGTIQQAWTIDSKLQMHLKGELTLESQAQHWSDTE